MAEQEPRHWHFILWPRTPWYFETEPLSRGLCWTILVIIAVEKMAGFNVEGLDNVNGQDVCPRHSKAWG